MALLDRLPAAIRQAACYGLAIILAKGVAFAMVPVFTHYLSPAEFAALDVIQTLADLLSVLIGLGLADTLFRFAGSAGNEAEQKRVAASILGLSLVTGCVFLIAGQLSAPLIASILPWPAGDEGGRVWEVRIILVSLSFSAVILVPLGWLRMRDRAGEYLFGSGGRAVAQAGLVAAALVLGFGITGILVGGMIACVTLATIVVYRQARETGIRFSADVFSRYGGYAAPLVGIGLLAFLTRSGNRWIIAGNVDAVALAHFALAAKIGVMTTVLLQPYEMWWLPRRFAVLAKDGGAAICARRGELGIAAALAAALLIGAAAPTVIVLMTPAEYHAAAVFAPALALLAALHASSTITNLGAYAGQNTVRPFFVEGVTALIAVAGALYLVPMVELQSKGDGAWGAIAAAAAALIFRLVTITLLAQSNKPVPYRVGRLLIAGLIGGVGTAALTVTQMKTAAPIDALAVGGTCLALLLAMSLVMGLVPVPGRLKTAAFSWKQARAVSNHAG